MFWKKSEYKSTAVSIVIHALILFILMAFNITQEVDLNEYVTIGFGEFGNSSSSGSISKSEPITIPIKEKEKKDVEVPVAKNVDETNEVSSPVVTKKEEKKIEKKVVAKKVETNKRRDDNNEGQGNYGFELDFGGNGKRKIYSYNIPPYPRGVSKEVNVKLRFTIMPDGSVGRIILIQKADTRLEAAAMNSLRQWRFEPLPEGPQSKPQSVAITFPFRLE